MIILRCWHSRLHLSTSLLILLTFCLWYWPWSILRLRLRSVALKLILIIFYFARTFHFRDFDGRSSQDHLNLFFESVEIGLDQVESWQPKTLTSFLGPRSHPLSRDFTPAAQKNKSRRTTNTEQHKCFETYGIFFGHQGCRQGLEDIVFTWLNLRCLWCCQAFVWTCVILRKNLLIF